MDRLLSGPAASWVRRYLMELPNQTNKVQRITPSQNADVQNCQGSVSSRFLATVNCAGQGRSVPLAGTACAGDDPTSAVRDGSAPPLVRGLPRARLGSWPIL